MASRKAFVFSLDSFVAFSIAIVIIYSLIYFSSIPYGYYGTLMQAHYLAKDTLVALSEAQNPDVPELSELGYIASSWSDENQQTTLTISPAAAKEKVGPLIPPQFGYKLEIQEEDGQDWAVVYDTATDPDDPHDKTYDKAQASSQIVVLGYHQFTDGERSAGGFAANPYGYMTCSGDLTQCGTGVAMPNPRDNTIMALVRLTVYT